MARETYTLHVAEMIALMLVEEDFYTFPRKLTNEKKIRLALTQRLRNKDYVGAPVKLLKHHINTVNLVASMQRGDVVKIAVRNVVCTGELNLWTQPWVSALTHYEIPDWLAEEYVDMGEER